jgi:hypothetical protein
MNLTSHVRTCCLTALLIACTSEAAPTPTASNSTAKPAPAHMEPNTPHQAPVEIQLDPGEIQSGEEIYVCQVYGNPFGRDVDVVMFESETDYSHHHFVFMSDEYNKPSAVYPCAEIPPTMPFAFTAQGNDVVNNYAAGMGVRINATQGLMVQAHFANVTADAIHPISKIRMYPGLPGAVQTHVGVFFFLMGPGAIPVTPPHSEITFPARSCQLHPYQANDVNIMWMVGHLHSKGTRVSASVDGEKIYETRDWSDPRVEWLSPVLHYATPQVDVSWDCDYRNDTDRPLMFGEGYSDTMCAVFGGYYPADPENPTQNCLELGAADSGMAARPTVPPPVSGPYTGSGAVTMGVGTTSDPDIYPCGRPAVLGTIQDREGGIWTVPAATSFQDASFPLAADLYNPCIKFQPSTVEEATASLRDENIVTVDPDGEVISAYVFADNYFEMYVNGVPVGKDTVPYTEFNSNIVRFRAKRPFQVAMHAVDWETHLGLGSEPFVGGMYDPGDAGIAAVFRDAAGQTIAVSDASWKVQTYYISPVQDLSCLREQGALRDSSTCSTAGTEDGSQFYGVHWKLPDGWMQPGFDDASWLPATTYTNERAGVANKPAFTSFAALFDDPTADAQFIWSSNLILDNEILARVTVP